MKEQWETVADDDRYLISNLGNLKRKDGKASKTCLNIDGYVVATCGVKGTKFIHRIIAKAFMPNPQNKAEINHIDANKQNNNINNLEWVTHKENCHHAAKLGLMNKIYYHGNGQDKFKYAMCDNNFNEIKRFDSIQDVYLFFGKEYKGGNHIGQCCEGKRKTIFGHKWKYVI